MSDNGKYYVVWAGRHPGIYDSWDEAQAQVAHWPGARFKSFKSKTDAIRAFRSESASDTEALATLLLQADAKATRTEPSSAVTSAVPSRGSASAATAMPWRAIASVDQHGVAVDASCLGNPGTMEYRAVSLATGKEIFRMGPFRNSTNNIGEYLALVHILALCEQKKVKCTIYSDSATGMAWLRNRRSKSTLQRTADNADSFNLLDRADKWVREHTWSNPVVKWDTKRWGEIPADFGRK